MINLVEHLAYLLDEDRIVKFDGKPYPKEGYAVILAGGPGSGKSYSANTSIPIDGKVTDVDHFKEIYIQMQKKGMRAKDVNGHGTVWKRGDDGKMFDTGVKDDTYSLGDAEDVSMMHGIIKKAGWKNKERGVFFGNRSGMRLENIIFDMTCKEAGDIEEVLDMCKPLGYKIVLVWCVCNRSEAMRRNLTRSRIVAEPIFHSIHNQVNQFIPDYLQHGERADEIDDAWFLFTSSNRIGRMNPGEVKDRCSPVNKRGNMFKIDSNLQRKLDDVLGPEEPSPSSPKEYLNFSKIQSMFKKEDLEDESKLPKNFIKDEQ